MASSASTTSRLSRFAVQPPTGIAFNGTALNIDHAGYLAQHDLIYLRPPREGAEAMALGDGDLGAMVWCPGHLRMQVQKNDLWADSPTRQLTGSLGPASNWRQPSAGALSLHTAPSHLEAPARFEQRLSLYSGVLTLQAESAHGSCQATLFAAATAGVIVLHYQDQALRNTERYLEISLWRDGHLFALGENIGILQAFPDRRYTLLARVAGKPTQARQKDKRTVRLEMPPFRSGSFTLYLTVATSHKTGDPVSMAKTRIQDAMNKGYEALLREHKQHWGTFWQKSFLRLVGQDHDPLPGYLENLWYLTLYHQAACSRGYDAPLPNGALWLHNGDARSGPALYAGDALRDMTAPLLAANHLELTAPYIETYHRMLPDLAARTGREFGVGGARFPHRFNRFGDAFDTPNAIKSETTPLSETPGLTESAQAAEEEDAELLRLLQEAPTAPPPPPPAPAEKDALGDGLAAALFVWEAYRYAPDDIFARLRAYPLLRACTTFALEYAAAHPEVLEAPNARAQLAAALGALLWAGERLNLDEDMRPEWRASWKALAGTTAPYRPECLLPFGALSAEEVVPCLSAWLMEMPQRPQGFVAPDGRTPDLQRAGQLCAGLNSLLLREEVADFDPENPSDASFGGVPGGILRVFPALPSTWNASFVLAAPGGFRISAEAVGGKVIYIAVQSLLGEVCRLVSPWGAGFPVRILNGREVVMETEEALIRFETRPGVTYLIERNDFPLVRAVHVRLGGRRNDKPKRFHDHLLGMYRE
ncbi:MAG TPA: DUF5703 domain-containing protein [Chthonomonadaceae bacterium]|nr:DUF5703 domain-containing protein [Chthonomonadaceae bacterium]